MAKKTALPQITLEDPKTGKTASLTDEQGVRALLAGVVERLGADSVWKIRLSEHQTERVAGELLRKYDNLTRALEAIKTAVSIHELLMGTSLEADAAAAPGAQKTTGPVDAVSGNDAVEKLAEDVGETVRELWPHFRREIEKTEGLAGKSATVKIVFVPETDEADAYIRVTAEMKIATAEVTRTSKVRDLGRGKRQLELWSS